MKVLITGATGLVGREIVDLYLKQNTTIHYLSTSKKKIVSRDNYKGFYWNPDRQEIDVECFEGVTAIINLAGASISRKWTKSHKNKILLSRLRSLETLDRGLVAIGGGAVQCLVSASAVGIYPSSYSNYYEEDEHRTDDSFLGEVVKKWEDQVAIFQKFGISIAKIRIGLALSEKGGALPKIAKPIQYFVGTSFGSGEQWQSWIHIEDLARIFAFVVDNRLNGVYNAVAPNPVTNGKLTRTLAQKFNKPLFLPNIPRTIMKLILGEMSYLLFSSQRASSKKIEDKGFDFVYTNLCGALEDIYSKKEDNGKSRAKYHQAEEYT